MQIKKIISFFFINVGYLVSACYTIGLIILITLGDSIYISYSMIDIGYGLLGLSLIMIIVGIFQQYDLLKDNNVQNGDIYVLIQNNLPSNDQ